MNIILFATSLSIGVSCFTNSPFFYDKCLEEKCYQLVEDKLKDLYDPLNCIVIDSDHKESKKPGIFIKFYGFNNRQVSYYVSGKLPEYLYHRSDIEEGNWESIVKRILDKIRSDQITVEDYDIFFTFDLFLSNLEVFKGDKLKESIKMIKESFKNQHPDNTVKYYTYKYLEQLNKEQRSRGYNCEEYLIFKKDEAKYYSFIHDDFRRSLREDLDTLIKNHEDEILSGLKVKYNLSSDNDVFVIYFFTLFSGKVSEDLESSEFKFLVNIWNILRHKKACSAILEQVFSEEKGMSVRDGPNASESSVSTDDNKIPEDILTSALEENKERLKVDNVYILIEKSRVDTVEKYILLMNSFLGEQTLGVNTCKFISRFFSILASDVKKVIAIILSGNIIEPRTNIDLRSDRNSTFTTYYKDWLEAYFNLSDNSKIDDISKKDAFEKLTQEITKVLRPKNDDELFVRKEYCDKMFKDYLNTLYTDCH